MPGRQPGAEPARVQIVRWLREHPGESFSAAMVARDTGLHPSTTAKELKDLLNDGQPGLVRINRTALRYDGPNAKPPPGEKLRIVKEPPAQLRAGIKLEVVGITLGGVVVARVGGRLFTVTPLEVK